MKFHDAAHPIWRLAKLALVLLTLVVVLWLNAEHFDKTELQTIITMFFALLGVEGVSSALSKKES